VNAPRELLFQDPARKRRDFRTERVDADPVIVVGGIAGTCAAITAARAESASRLMRLSLIYRFSMTVLSWFVLLAQLSRGDYMR
jgi:hypothetical protein